MIQRGFSIVFFMLFISWATLDPYFIGIMLVVALLYVFVYEMGRE